MRVGLGGISGTNILSIGRGVSVSGGGGFVGPYDDIDDIAALYAMRRARSDYTDALIRVRRDSDNEEQDIGYTSAGDLDTAALASWLGEANGYITTWYDQSGNGNHAAQSTAASQPLYSNGLPRFDGVDDYLDTGVVPVNNQAWSVVLRHSDFTWTAFAALAGCRWSIGNIGFLLAQDASGNRRYRNGGDLVVAGDVAAGVRAVAGNRAYLDGVAESGTIGTAAGDNSHSVYIGAQNDQGAAANFALTHIHEVVISATTYTAQQVAAITGIMEAA